MDAMPSLLVALLLFAFAQQPKSQPPLTPLLARVASEAESFQQNIPKATTRETLVQRAAMPPSRPPRLGVREIASEYSVGSIKGMDSHDLVEFRQVVSVDGLPVQSAESARHALSLGIRSEDERIRKRMLEDFAKYGLVDIATDYGLILLAFTRQGLETIQTGTSSDNRIGADEMTVLTWKQTSGTGGELEFHGRQAVRQPLQGTLWVRKSDGTPLRIQTWAEYSETGHKIRDEATIDYAMSSHGFLAPVSVVHRHIVDKGLRTENVYHYEPFNLDVK
jgi:hypothetical protein